MIRLVLAAATAFALAGAAPAYACGADCPMHKTASADAGTTVAAAEKKDVKTGCGCHDSKDCKCAAGKCDCPNCHAKKETKEGQKKS